MSSIEDYSGLCGIIPTFAGFDNRIRCKYEFGHGGPCSFEKHRKQFSFHYAGCNSYDKWWASKKNEDGESNGFIESVLDHSKYNHYSIMLTSAREIKIR